jgi:Archaeal ATPase./Tetratricopeptide repeat.
MEQGRDLFVSYAKEDTREAHDIASALGRAGLTTWLYEEDGADAGMSYLFNEGQAIQQARGVVLIGSGASLRSHQVRLEVERAHACAKPLYPVLLDIAWEDIQEGNTIWSMAIGTRTAVSLLRDQFDRAMERLIRGINCELTQDHVPHAPNKPIVVGLIDQVQLDHFQDREAETAALQALLARREMRFTTIVGRGGIGKTSLVAKLVRDLVRDRAEQPDTPKGIVLIDLKDKGSRSPDAIVDWLLKTETPGRARDFRVGWEGCKTLQLQMDHLFQRLLCTGRRLIVLDNFEYVLDDHDQIAGDYKDLAQFVQACLEVPHQATVIATSRRRICLALDVEGRLGGYRTEINLNQGLPPDCARTVLRMLDNGEPGLGVRDAPDDVLDQVVGCCGGVPRTLERVLGVLRNEQTNLQWLVARPTHFARVLDLSAGELYESLNDSGERQVLEALAVFGQPASVEAMKWLLQDLFFDPVLDRLIGRYAVQCSPESGLLSLVSCDFNYIYKQAGARDGGRWKTELHRRAAKWFARLCKADQEWQCVADVEPQLRQIRHLVACEDFDEACELLNTIDRENLAVWGQHATTIDLRRQMKDGISDLNLRALNLGNLGCACFDTGDVTAAAELYEKALDLTRQSGDRQAECRWLGNLGMAKRALGLDESKGSTQKEKEDLFRASRELLDRGYALACEVGNRRHQGRWMGKIAGHRLIDGLATPAETVAALEEALAIAREDGDRRFEMYWLDDLSKLYGQLGKPSESIECLAQEAELAGRIGAWQRQADLLLELGRRWMASKDFEQAVRRFEQAGTVLGSLGQRPTELSLCHSLAQVYMELDRPAKAIDKLERVMLLLQEEPALGEALSIDVYNVLVSLGSACWYRKESLRAISYYELALDKAREANNRMRECMALYNIGDAFHQLGRLEEAERYCVQSLETDDIRVRCKALLTLGMVLSQLDRRAEALDRLYQGERAAQCYLEGDPNEFWMLNALALAQLGSGKTEEGLANLRLSGTASCSRQEIHLALQDLDLLRQSAPGAMGLDEAERFLREDLKRTEESRTCFDTATRRYMVTDKVEVLRSKVESYLRQKQVGYEARSDGTFWIRQGSTIVTVSANAWGERTLVKLAAPVALDITKITPELTRFLLEKNSELLFGKFSLDTRGRTIWYEHVLLGDFLDVEELFIAVAAVALTADEHDEQVSKMADGRRAADL